MAISSDAARDAQDTAQKLGLRFPVLADTDLDIIKRYGVFDAGNQTAWPAIFVVGQNGSVLWRSLSETYKERPATALILEQLQRPTAQ